MSTIPSLALIPSGVKASKVYSVLPTDGTGDFDFSRGTIATRVNSEGLIELVSTNVPRLNYPLIDGVVSGCPSLLLEPQRINNFSYSEDFGNGSWSKSNSSISTDSTISPDGTLNADTFLITSNSGFFSKAFSLASGTTVTQSVFVKNINADRINLQVRTASTAGLASFFFTNSEITSVTLTTGLSADFENYGNGWYRIYLTCTTTETNQLFRFQLSESGMSCYLWGAMAEASSYPTSYIPTTTTTATRSAETCNNAGDANTFNDSEGVLMAEISALSNDGTFRFISLSDGTSSNRISLFFSTSNTLNAGGVGISSIGGVSGIENNKKVAFKYKSGDYALWVNGIEVGTSTVTNGNHANLNRLNFDFGQGSDDFYGNIKEIQYFPTALNDSDLETLTSWDSFSDMATSQLYSIE